MTKRHQLSAQDRDVLDQARVEWAALAFSTAPVDRSRTEAAMEAMYSLVGKAPPRFKWVSDPGELVADLPRHHRLVAPSNPLVAWALHQPIRQMIDALIHQGAVMAYSEVANDMRVPSWSGNVGRLADMLRPWRIRDVGPMLLPNCFVPNVSSNIDLGLLEFFARRVGRRYEMLMWPHAELARAGLRVGAKKVDGPQSDRDAVALRIRVRHIPVTPSRVPGSTRCVHSSAPVPSTGATNSRAGVSSRVPSGPVVETSPSASALRMPAMVSGMLTPGATVTVTRLGPDSTARHAGTVPPPVAPDGGLSGAGVSGAEVSSARCCGANVATSLALSFAVRIACRAASTETVILVQLIPRTM